MSKTTKKKKNNTKKKNSQKSKTSSNSKTNKTSKNNSQIKVKKTKKQTKSVQKKNSKRKKNNKKKNTKTNKIIYFIIITIILIIPICIFSYRYIYDNYFYKQNYLFQTNLDNTTVQLTSSTRKLDTIQENIKDSTLYISPYYDQIVISNSLLNESLSNKEIFFKYYNENNAILPINKQIIIDYIYFNPLDDKKVTFISDNDCVSINNNVITAIKDGETSIYACYGEVKEKLIDIISSSLIIDRPKEFDDTKPFLTCEQYSNEENEMLDKILETKINNAGYLTRAGTVEALRFLALDMPYRVDYFNENGRLPYIDAQGRYYHKGLYLSSGKYQELNNPKNTNKGTWGCKIYSSPMEMKMENGLDCSGLMGWAMVNAGFDPGDIKGSDLLLTLGDKYNSKEIINSGKVKVGDFVHNNELTSHIGMIIGIDDDENYYVCQSIWYKPNGVCISKYTKEEFVEHWLRIVLLDKYYQNDGNLTNMWY